MPLKAGGYYLRAGKYVSVKVNTHRTAEAVMS